MTFSRNMISAVPESPPTWLRILAVSSALLGGFLGVLLLYFTIRFDRSEYTISRKYVSEPGDQYCIFAEVSPGDSSINASCRQSLFDAASPGDTLILRGFGLNTISRGGLTVAWEISTDVLIPVVFTASAFAPLLLLQRFRRVWVRGICYSIGGLLASLITLNAIFGLLASG